MILTPLNETPNSNNRKVDAVLEADEAVKNLNNCKSCGKVFKTSTTLKKHQNTKHKSQK